MPYAVGVDIGGSSAKLGVVDQDGRIVSRRRVPTPPAQDQRTFAEAYATAIAELIAEVGTDAVSGVGVGVPGHVLDDGATPACSNVALLDGFPLRRFLADRLGLPVRLDNDGTLAALAEHRFGNGQSRGRLLVVTIGTGIGLGLVVDGQPQRPVRGCMGDPGHLIVDPAGGRRCRMGCRGCLETVATSLALEREGRARAKTEPDSPLGRILAETGDLPARHIIRAALDGDATAASLVTGLAAWVGIACTSWAYVYDPEIILFGGGVSAAYNLAAPVIRETIASTGMRAYADAVDLGPTAFGNESGIIGAAALVIGASHT